ncbi:DUF3536 domain-containing protein [Thermoproteota archaeon]
MNKYLCVHGHFYQPPRNNPWLESVELEESAKPYHDWNERITAECYAPNTQSRILGPNKFIIDIINNYSKISFNFGPTLLNWLEKNAADTYQAILKADKLSQTNFNGHRSAIAQVYNHIIMPLATTQEKRLEISWGIQDFTYRFKRFPEGMWLAETAVDIETLEILAEYKIKFTILAPHQAARFRRKGDPKWVQNDGQNIDTKTAYTCTLPSGRSISLFFYDGPIAHEVSFGTILKRGDLFASTLLSAFHGGDGPQLVHIATDGETYGHHHPYGDMALAFCLNHIEKNQLATLTIYGQYLELFPLEFEVEIRENTSWSCAHGVERWHQNCGCNSGQNPEWNQKWRTPLRKALNWLRADCEEVYIQYMSRFVKDHEAILENYISVILDRSSKNIEDFLKKNIGDSLSKTDKITVLKLLELRRNTLLMYTSCGWFFDDISGIETVQILRYAARSIQLAQEISGCLLAKPFKKMLNRCRSNLTEMRNGEKVYQNFVKPAALTFLRVGAHYAVSSIFRDYPKTAQVYTYKLTQKSYMDLEIDKYKLTGGTLSIKSYVTLEEKQVDFTALYIAGNHNVISAVDYHINKVHLDKAFTQLKHQLSHGKLTEMMQTLDANFERSRYNVWHLFRDEQKRVLNQIFHVYLDDTENAFRNIYSQYSGIMQDMKELNMAIPGYFEQVMAFIFSQDICYTLGKDPLDLSKLRSYIYKAKQWSLKLDKETIAYHANKALDILMREWMVDYQNLSSIRKIILFLHSLKSLNIRLNLWQIQNNYFIICQKHFAKLEGNHIGKLLKQLASYLYVKV